MPVDNGSENGNQLLDSGTHTPSIMDGRATQNGVEELEEAYGEQGRKVSPLLPSTTKNYLIDIDGTIGEDVPNEEPERMSKADYYPDALKTVNKWYSEGHVITFFTARTEEHRQVTESWLDKCGFLYHGLLMDKPRGGNYHWIDNHIVRATKFNTRFTDLVRRTAEIEVFDDD